MIVITKMAEHKFLDDMRLMAQSSSAQKCFLLEFSKISIDPDRLHECFLRILHDIPNSYLAQVYMCQDGDIFILMQAFMQRHFMVFVDKLDQEIADKHILSLVQSFELGIHLEALEFMMRDKIERIHEQEKEESQLQEKQKNINKAQHILSGLDSSLISTLQHRRTNRKESVILIVDDDQLSRTLAGNALSEKFRINYAKDAQEAFRIYLEDAPDTLFLDIVLPDLNGHVVLECLFQMDPDAYVIMFSGRNDKNNIMRALRTGAQGFIGKPFTRKELLEYAHRSPFDQKRRARSSFLIKEMVQ